MNTAKTCKGTQDVAASYGANWPVRSLTGVYPRHSRDLVYFTCHFTSLRQQGCVIVEAVSYLLMPQRNAACPAYASPKPSSWEAER